MAGNWRSSSAFVGIASSDLEDAGQIGPSSTRIIVTADLLEQSNAEVIAEAMRPFLEGTIPMSCSRTHDHWAVGGVDGLSVRVYRAWPNHQGVSDLARTVIQRLADYPVLDEDDYSSRIYEATMENIADAAWRVKRDYTICRRIGRFKVYHWLVGPRLFGD